jgi:hypothetical protein
MKKLITAVLGFLTVAVLLVACGGGGASSSTHGQGRSVAEISKAEAHRLPKQKQAHASARQERRKEKENREFKEQEEARVRKEEAHRIKQKEKAEDKQPKPKPEPTSVPAPSDVDPIAAEEFQQFTGVDHGNWEIAYEVCGSTPAKQLAKEFHTEDNWAAIGHAYGHDEYREPFNIAPEEGCMAALKVSKAQWEATLEELPFKEL